MDPRFDPRCYIIYTTLVPYVGDAMANQLATEFVIDP